jgi:hypothetical protein
MTDREIETRADRPFDPWADLDSKIAGVVAESLSVIDEDRGWKPIGPKQKDPSQWSELDLRNARQDSRNLCKRNEFAIGATKNRVNYTVGSGFGVAVDPVAGRPKDDPTVVAVADYLKAFSDLADLKRLARNAVKLSDKDGDCMIRIYDTGSNRIPEVRVIYANWIQTPPQQAGNAAIQHGVEFLKLPNGEIDTETPVAYHLQKSLSGDYERIPAEEIVHVRLDDDPEISRGVPTFEPAIGALLRCEDILRALGTTTVARAKLSLLWKTDRVNKRTEDNLKARLTSTTQTDSSGNQVPATVERMPFGSVLRVPREDDVSFPAGNVGAIDMVESLQAQLRAVAAMLNMPEWMFTGRAVEKFANAFVAEGPTTKEMESIQAMIAERLVTKSMGRHASLCWRVIRIGVKNGLIPSDAFEAVTLKAILPTLIVRNAQEEANVHGIYLANRIISRPTVQEKLGLDPATEQSRWEEDPHPPVPPKPVPELPAGAAAVDANGNPVAAPSSVNAGT